MTTDTPTVAAAAPGRPFERRLPPVIPVAMVALALAVTGGVILSAGATTAPSLVPPTLLIATAVGLEVIAAVMVARVRPFAWGRFRQVLMWALVAYTIQGGMIVYSFVRNDVPGGPLTVLVLGLVVFATDVPLMIAYTVARYERV